MGIVWEAQHLLMDRRVALKLIRCQYAVDGVAVDRFRREVRVAAQLQHPHIVAAYDAEQAGQTHFLVMEYVEGRNLESYLRSGGRLGITEACRYARQAAFGLQHAHEHGMVHRDIKPHNLMRTPGGQIKILDFGLARLGTPALEEFDVSANEAGLCAGVEPLTVTGTVMGTPDYLAPEQAVNSATADIRADIYSLGCSLYQLLTGEVPFPGGSPREKIDRHAISEPRPLADLRPDVPVALAGVIARMMAKAPAERYQTPAEVATALQPFAEPATGRGKWFWFLPLFLLLGLALGGVALAWRSGPSTKQPSEPPDAQANRPGDQGIQAWGEWIDPAGDCTVQREKTKFIITAGGGGGHFLRGALASSKAPRILRPVSGDFIATVKVTGDFKAREEFIAAGWLLVSDDQTYLRFERNIWRGGKAKAYSIAPLFEYTEDGVNLTKSIGFEQPFFKGNSTYLELTRRGNQVDWGVSHDGQTWIRGQPLDVKLARDARLGFSVTNCSSEPFTVEFAEYRLVAP